MSSSTGANDPLRDHAEEFAALWNLDDAGSESLAAFLPAAPSKLQTAIRPGDVPRPEPDCQSSVAGDSTVLRNKYPQRARLAEDPSSAEPPSPLAEDSLAAEFQLDAPTRLKDAASPPRRS